MRNIQVQAGRAAAAWAEGAHMQVGFVHTACSGVWDVAVLTQGLAWGGEGDGDLEIAPSLISRAALPSIPRGVGSTATHPIHEFYSKSTGTRCQAFGAAWLVLAGVWLSPGPLQPQTSPAGQQELGDGARTGWSLPPVSTLTGWKCSLTSLKPCAERDR